MPNTAEDVKRLRHYSENVNDMQTLEKSLAASYKNKLYPITQHSTQRYRPDRNGNIYP